MEELDILDLNDDVLVQVYQGDNYQCFDTGVDSDICYIMFSSNGLYYPNTKEVFEETIIQNDRYEWKWVVKNSTIPRKAGRIIYVRDIYKCWYSKGINARENTIDKTLELLEKLTQGYKIVTVGSSAGGYMAVLTAIKLKADYCINFSGQYSIATDIENPYHSLMEMLNDYAGHIFYFFPIGCEEDKRQYDNVKHNKCINSFLFNESKHASTMFAGNMCYILDYTEEEMIGLYEKNCRRKINKYLFLLQTVPLIKVFDVMKREIRGFLVRKSGKHWMGV